MSEHLLFGILYTENLWISVEDIFMKFIINIITSDYLHPDDISGI